MPFWDKSRLLVHGRLTTAINNMKWIYSVSQDPYNSAELLDWTWNNAVTDWTNGMDVARLTLGFNMLRVETGVAKSPPIPPRESPRMMRDIKKSTFNVMTNISVD